MNLAEISIKKAVITWTLTVVVLVVGFLSYQGLPRLEDPEFAIKDAVISTPYPGASPEEVEQEVTEKIEKAMQELGQLKRVESYSSRGLSVVRVKIKDNYDNTALPAVWDEMRRKVLDVIPELPPGAGPPLVNDDFGDVFGVYFALTGPGYTFAELKDVAELLKRELLVVPDVKKVTFFGEQTEAIYVEMSRTKMASLGITRQEIFDALQAKNLPVDSGSIKIGSEYMAIKPTGEFDSEKAFNDLFIASKEGKLIYLRDVATIVRDYVDPPRRLLRVNGEPAIGIAISTVLGGNAVTMGEGVLKRINELQQEIPIGMDLTEIVMQSKAVTKAINSFVINLMEAVAIVIVVLLFFMGLRSGLIIGFILLLTIAATFVVMGYYQITLERISLGALIIALGMLVDNAIVVVDGMKVRMEQGMDGLKAARQVVGQNSIPLLGATVVAILAFASIGGMDNQTGEYTRSLYYVILISLSLSWLTAVTVTPLLTK
ncbi:MAG: efflux RND transporter permease subunit, partial [Desulfofustis sp.]|nr:efflux RND transporter permease subunit [Desulfofustis sp.]